MNAHETNKPISKDSTPADAVFTISHLTSSPDGLTVESRPIGRTEAASSPLVLTAEQRDLIKEGMSKEMRFSGVDKLRSARRAYRQAVLAGSPDMQALKDAFFKEREAYQNKGRKLGLRALRVTEDNVLHTDLQFVPFPMYNLMTKPDSSEALLNLSRAFGTAMVVRTSDNRLVVQHRGVKQPNLTRPGNTPGNATYADIPGASVAGMADASMKSKDRKPGTPDAIDTNSTKQMILTEAAEELGLDQDDLRDLRIIGVAQDLIKPHDEILLVADTTLTAAELEESSRVSSKNKDLHEFDMAEKFFDIPATPEAIETLLCEVRCPLPPAHAAAFVAAGYLMVLESTHNKEKADRWRAIIQERIANNYARINEIVRDFYVTNTSEVEQVPERYWSSKAAPKRNLNGYDPAYTPNEQGLPSFEDEMIYHGLLPETREHVQTGYLFDVDGVLADPVTKEVIEPQIFTEIIKRLELGEPVCFNTGRSVEWMKDRLIVPLIELMKTQKIPMSKLDRLIATGEKGGTWMTFDEDGKEHIGVTESIAIPEELKCKVRDLINRNKKYKDAMFFDETKLTMISVEMHDGYDLKAFTAIQIEFTKDLQEILATTEGGEKYRIDPTTIGTDIESPYVSKALGANRLLHFMRLRGVTANSFTAFGDSASDLKMADELAKMGKQVEMIYVGNTPGIGPGTRKYTVKTPGGFTKGTADYLQTNDI